MMQDLMEQLAKHPTLGVIRLDYDYPAAPGDIDSPDSYDYPVVFRVVPGLTFQMAQSGIMTPDVKEAFAEAVRWLADDQQVSVITGDCGFMLAFQDFARSLTATPVFLSALMQLPTVSAALCKNHDKVIILTANVESLTPMKPLISRIAGVRDDQSHYAYVGCEDVSHFGYEVENGLQVDVAKAEPGILEKAKQAVAMYPRARAFLFECTELPPYSDAVRAATGLPVYDAITNCNFVMEAFLDNERFGRDAWYEAWDGKQVPYQFGQYLTDEQRKKLVSKPVDEHAMHMIMEQLEGTTLVNDLKAMGYIVTTEDLAHAVAGQVETNEALNNMKKLEAEMEKKPHRLQSRVKNFFRRITKSKGQFHLPSKFKEDHPWQKLSSTEFSK